ncbi:adenylate/guanylate cyclase [Parasphingorhabdus marina DSM 22363]|uniref:Adenylate/guanylate cyclase n=1 Tax=Parasphingorhabdus marina DSM 22363 TaxID=1123272 RepID=A0A1N6GZ14_9SPHN|nr:adenylate/guanylate cyclase domain-containing protein [Parasphingorhabdus marina]SIO12759.1 adenylate/guanylate cyclase [Parasphingorhabdus marina DSM 22363]
MVSEATTQDPANGGRDVEKEARSAVQSIRRIFAQLGPVRLASTLFFLILAILIAGLSWKTPLIQDAERALYDLRASVFAPVVEKDDRIVMIVYNEETLRLTGQRSPVDRTILAQSLETIDAAGAKSIGIDILFDMPQDDDPLLINMFRSMQTPTFLAYANAATNPEITFAQQQFLDDYLTEFADSNVKPTTIRLDTDGDGVQRRWNAPPEGSPPFLAIAMTGPNPAFASYSGAIRYFNGVNDEIPVFDKFPIESFADPATADMLASFIKDKYVLIGGDFIDRDRFETPISSIATSQDDVSTQSDDAKMIGLEVHAHMLAQLLNDDQPAAIPTWALWVAAVIVAACGGLSAVLIGNSIKIALILISQFLFFVIFPFVLHNIGIDTLTLPAFGWGLGWLLGYASVGSAARTINSKQRSFAQNALGKYLPKSIAGEILRDPEKLALHGEKRQIFAVFTDLEGFTKLSHAIEPEMVATLLNDYLDRLSDVALEYGGTIDKFVGDALVAFWGAPIAYADDGERAAKAAFALYEAGEEFRKNVPEGVPPIGRTRVGMHYGDAIVGNFGGEGRIQYTALGDAMNTAARLEAANKALETKVLVSREAMEKTGLDWYRPMGRITLRGRSTPVDVFEPVPDWEEKDRAAVTAVIAAHQQGDNDAVQALGAMIKQYGEDLGLANLIKRLEKTKHGESYALG